MVSYVLTFCRIVIGLVFAWSFAGKVRDITAFTQTINQFQILPARLTKLAGYAFFCGEGAVTLSMLVGGSFLPWGFFLAAFLLTVFCVALGWVLLRKIETSCNCLGSSQKPVSFYDLVRNIGFIVCAVGGNSVLVMNRDNSSLFGWIDTILVALAALVFVIVWVQLGEIAQLVRN